MLGGLSPVPSVLTDLYCKLAGLVIHSFILLDIFELISYPASYWSLLLPFFSFLKNGLGSIHIWTWQKTAFFFGVGASVGVYPYLLLTAMQKKRHSVSHGAWQSCSVVTQDEEFNTFIDTNSLADLACLFMSCIWMIVHIALIWDHSGVLGSWTSSSSRACRYSVYYCARSCQVDNDNFPAPMDLALSLCLHDDHSFMQLSQHASRQSRPAEAGRGSCWLSKRDSDGCDHFLDSACICQRVFGDSGILTVHLNLRLSVMRR